MGLRSFVDIDAWQVARQLTKRVCDITSTWHYRHKGLADQMDRASVSIMANIAEGFDSSSDADFSRYLVYSRQSVSELQSHLYVAKDLGLIKAADFDLLYQLCDRVKSMVIAFMKYLKQSSKPATTAVDVGRRTSDGL